MNRPSAWSLVQRLLGPALALVMIFAGCIDPARDDDQGADLVLHGGTVWTGTGAISDATSDATSDAIAIADGRITALGAQAEAMRGDAARVIDLEGRLVLPAFRDHHTHALRQAAVGAPVSDFRPEYVPASETERTQGHVETHLDQTAYHGSRQVTYPLGVHEESPMSYEMCEPAGTVTDAMLQNIQDVESELASQGLTTIVEAQGRDMTHVAALKQLEEEGALKLRWQIRVVPGCYPHLDDVGLERGGPDDQVRLLGVKLYADGYMGGWIAALREPYSDRPDTDGILVYDDASLQGFVRQAKQMGLNVGTHAIGDAAAEQVLEAYEAVGFPEDHRWTIEHAQLTQPDLVAKMADLGVVASIQLSFATTDQHFAPSRLGDRVDHAYQWRTMEEAGIVLAGSSDYPVEVINPLWGLQRIVTRQEVDGSDPWHSEEALSMPTALRSITWGQAYAAHEEQERGTLEVGKYADLVILDQDIIAVPEQAASAAVTLTLVDGRIVFEGEQAYPPS